MLAIHRPHPSSRLPARLRAWYAAWTALRGSVGRGLWLMGIAAICSGACGGDESIPEQCLEDAECPSELGRCHTTAHVCVPDCAAGGACPEGELCGPDTKLCMCKPEADRCPAGQRCHIEDLICVSIGCEGCAGDRTCCEALSLCLANGARCETAGGTP